MLFTFLNILNPATTGIMLFLAVLLFVLSFFIAGCEVAFFSLTTKDINLLKTKQQPSFRRIVRLLEEPKTLQATMLIANVFVNIGAILVCNFLLNQLLEKQNFSPAWLMLLKIGIITLLIVLFAEVLPKVWAAHHKVWFASSSSLILEIFNSIFYRVSRRIVNFTDKIEKRIGDKADSMHDNNLDYVIDLLPEHEASNEEKQILKGIRKFGDTEVKQIMRTRMDVNGIEYNCNFKDVISKIEALHYSRLPVYKNNLDEIVGMLHTKDLLLHLNENNQFEWQPLIRPAYFVH